MNILYAHFLIFLATSEIIWHKIYYTFLTANYGCKLSNLRILITLHVWNIGLTLETYLIHKKEQNLDHNNLPITRRLKIKQWFWFEIHLSVSVLKSFNGYPNVSTSNWPKILSIFTAARIYTMILKKYSSWKLWWALFVSEYMLTSLLIKVNNWYGIYEASS